MSAQPNTTAVAPIIVTTDEAVSPPTFSPPAFSDVGSSPPNTGAFAGFLGSTPPTQDRDRRASDEWDASKVPPSRFQKRKGSIYSTPNSRDGHIDSNYAAKFHAKHAELGYNKK